MISTVASPSTETPGVAMPATGDLADSGVFDVLLTLQSQANADTAAAVNAPRANPLEGVDLVAGLLEDSTKEPADDSTKDGAEPVDGALWFLNTLLPAPKVPASTVAVAASAGSRIHMDAAPAGSAPPVGGQPVTATDPAQTLSFGANPESRDSQSPAPDTQASVTPVIDTTTWNSLTGSAELIAQATKQGTTKQGTTERAEAAPLTIHVRDPRWADDLGNRLASMVRTGESSASLQLTPPDLGPLEVNVSVRENQATVHFGAANAETRALLEASMPRLREMLAAQGFALMDSSVSHGFARRTRHESAGTPRAVAIGEAPMPGAQAIHITGLLDLYA